MKHFGIQIIIVLFFSSCVSMNFISIQTRQPASVSFPPEVATVLIVDNCPNERQMESDAKESKVLSSDSARTIFLNSLTKFMNEEKYFYTVSKFPHKIGRSKNDNDAIPLSTREIKELSLNNDADVLISLDLFAISMELETESTGYFSSYSTLHAKSGALINVYTKSGERYTQPIVYLDSLFRTESSDWSKMKKNVTEINDMITEMAVVAADRLTAKFVPSWKMQERMFFSDASGEMKKAARLVNKRSWSEAADIWASLFDKEKKVKKKMHLAFNLALANECLDDVPNAFNWINVAYDLLPEKSESDLALQIVTYKKILELRINDMTKLEEQFGESEEAVVEGG